MNFFASQCQVGKVQKLFKFCALFLPMISFFFYFDMVVFARESAVRFLMLFDGWELYFVCCIDWGELILWLVLVSNCC